MAISMSNDGLSDLSEVFSWYSGYARVELTEVDGIVHATFSGSGFTRTFRLEEEDQVWVFVAATGRVPYEVADKYQEDLNMRR